jgi:hypothetical protein
MQVPALASRIRAVDVDDLTALLAGKNAQKEPNPPGRTADFPSAARPAAHPI